MMCEAINIPPEGNWNYEYITENLIQAERVKNILFSGQTPYQSIMIVDGGNYGRSLLLDGKTQSTEADEFIYHEALVQPVMLAHSNPRTIFIAGGGEGATAREILMHRSVKKAVMVDIDAEVVKLCKKYLPNHHRGAFDDPRLDLHYGDAFRYLAKTDDRFDVIIIDVPDPLEAGPAYLLFTKEFYTLAKSKLRSQGMLVAQAGPTGPTLNEQCFTLVSHTINNVFDSTYPYEALVPSFGGNWGFVIGSKGPNPASIDRDVLDEQIKARITGTLKFFDGTTNHGLFSIPKYLRASLENETRVITCESPLFVA